MFTVRSVTPTDYSGIILLLRKYFFPHEPAAVGLDLCPKGTKILWFFLLISCLICLEKPVKIFSKKEKLEESETKTTPRLDFLPTISSLLPKKIFIPPESSN